MASQANGGLPVPGDLTVFGDTNLHGDLAVTGAISVVLTSFIALTPQADPPTAVEGRLYSDTDHKLYYYNGTAWKEVSFAA